MPPIHRRDNSLEMLYRALESPIGIVISTTNVVITTRRLESARKDAGDPELRRLYFRRGPTNPEGEIWIVKGPKDDESQ